MLRGLMEVFVSLFAIPAMIFLGVALGAFAGVEIGLQGSAWITAPCMAGGVFGYWVAYLMIKNVDPPS